MTCLLLQPPFLMAQDPIVYPAKGQDAKTMDRDKHECYNWAKEQTGFDPMQPPQTTAAAPPPQSGGESVGRSVVRGAAIGGLAGSMGGEFGKGAAVGAGAGLVGGGIRNRRQADAQKQQQAASQQQAANQYQSQRDGYNRAFGACMEGRGYSVK